MIHASVELVEAMRGVAPRQAPGSVPLDALRELTAACDAGNGSDAGGELAAIDYASHRAALQDNTRRTDCPACLRLMREAVDPVRWDYLEERGLAPKLEAA